MRFHLELGHPLSLILASLGYLLYAFLMISNLMEVDDKLVSFLADLLPLMLFFGIGIIGLHVVIFLGFFVLLRKKNEKDFREMLAIVHSKQKKQEMHLIEKPIFDSLLPENHAVSVKCLQNSSVKREPLDLLEKPSQATMTTNSRQSMTQFDIHNRESRTNMSISSNNAPIEYFKLIPAVFILAKNLLDMAFLVYTVSHLVSGGITLFLTCMSISLSLMMLNFSLLDQLFFNTDDGKARMELRELHRDLEAAKTVSNLQIFEGNISQRIKARIKNELVSSYSGKTEMMMAEKPKSKEGARTVEEILKQIKNKRKHTMLSIAFVTIGNISMMLAGIGFFIRQTIMIIDKFSVTTLMIFGSTIVGLGLFALLRHKIQIDTMNM